MIIVMVPLNMICFFMTVRSVHTDVNTDIIATQQEGSRSQQKQQQSDNFESSLLQLRCFTTPGCFPTVKCRQGIPQKIARQRKYEEQSFCIDDVRGSSSNSSSLTKSENVDSKGCLVYSFGVYNSLEWEAKVAHYLGCEVHAFDPTMDFPSNIAPGLPGLTFHRLGLQGEGTDMSTTHAVKYDAIDPSLLLSLEDIMIKLGHQNRVIDVLMLDCEGCEWGVLRQLVCEGGDTAMVKQIMTEFHFQYNLGLKDERDVMIAAEAVSCLRKDRWAVTSIETNNAGWREWKYARGVSSVIHSESTLILMSLRRIANHEKMPDKLIEEYATAKRKHSFQERLYEKQFGDDTSLWPPDAIQNVTALANESTEAKNAMESVVVRRAIFDDHPHMVEKDRKEN